MGLHLIHKSNRMVKQRYYNLQKRKNIMSNESKYLGFMHNESGAEQSMVWFYQNHFLMGVSFCPALHFTVDRQMHYFQSSKFYCYPHEVIYSPLLSREKGARWDECLHEDGHVREGSEMRTDELQWCRAHEQLSFLGAEPLVWLSHTGLLPHSGCFPAHK